MDFQFRPFGIGFVMSQEEARALKVKVVEQVKWSSLVAVGLSLCVAEVVTCKVANALSDASQAVADVHDHVIVAQQFKHDRRMIDHAMTIGGESINLVKEAI